MKIRILLPALLSLSLAACGSDSAEYAASGRGAGYSGGDAVLEMAVPATPPSGQTFERRAYDMKTEAPQAASAPTDLPQTPGAVDTAVSLGPMLIRTGTAMVQVDSLEEGITRVRALAERVGGIVANTSVVTGREEEARATMQLRIPSARFDAAIEGLKPIGKVRSVDVTAEDVGEEFTDVTARVANARRLETRLVELLATRSGKLDDVLAVERELARVREQIERYEGRLRYLRTRVSVSTLTITLHEPRALSGAPGDRPLRDAFGAAWRNFVRTLAAIIASLGWIVPLGIGLYALWRLVRWLRRRDADRAVPQKHSEA